MSLTHIDEDGQARMVDVSGKPVTLRRAKAAGVVRLKQSTMEAITQGRITKGDVFTTARVAGIIAAKRCSELIPLCHSLPLDSVSIGFDIAHPSGVEITTEAVCTGRTGVEMEALTAVMAAALTIYDMIKAIDREAVIGDIRLIEKSGGRSGHFVREEERCPD